MLGSLRPSVTQREKLFPELEVPPTDPQERFGACSKLWVSFSGAVADSTVVSVANEAGFNPESYLNNNDAFTFFSQLHDGRYLLDTGLTGTNVMDIQVLLVHPTS